MIRVCAPPGRLRRRESRPARVRRPSSTHRSVVSSNGAERLLGAFLDHVHARQVGFAAIVPLSDRSASPVVPARASCRAGAIRTLGADRCRPKKPSGTSMTAMISRPATWTATAGSHDADHRGHHRDVEPSMESSSDQRTLPVGHEQVTCSPSPVPQRRSAPAVRGVLQSAPCETSEHRSETRELVEPEGLAWHCSPDLPQPIRNTVVGHPRSA